MSGLHELFCLGVPRLVSPAGVDVRFKARKHLALLVYLAVEPRRHQRDLLVDLLWPTASPSAARQSLSTAVSVLRSKLGKDALIGEPGTLRLVPGRARLDLERLESGDVLGNELVLPLEVDGFLEGFEVPDAPEFGHWRDRQHARLLPAIKAALIRLADFARRTADVRRLSRSADRLLAIDDLAEEGIRARMEASALTGDRLTAIRVYDEWSDRLAKELGATPPPLLEGMALRLRRRGWERPVTSPVPTVRTEQWRDRPFVGRKREYRVLYETWEGVAQGMPRHILIVGDSGVGKTTLADRLATAIGLEGATVSRVRCFELERGIPYAAIGGVLAHLLDRPGAAAANPETLAELGRIIPEVRHRYANLPVTPDTQGESARIRFAEAALDFLTALMEEHPVVLIVDDFQLADEASLAVLHLLMRRIEHRPWMVIMASREELPEGAVHGARIRDGANYLGVTELELGPMPPEESGLLLDALIQQSTGRPTATERRALLTAAGGYPMALELMFRDWEERGADSLAISLGAMTVDVATNLDHTYRRLAASLDRALDPTIRTVLHMAAVLDRRLNEFEMYGLIDVSMGQTLTALAELVSRHTLRDTGTGLEFVNPGLRANAYLGIPTPLRRMLHHHVAGRLLERLRGGEDIPGLEVAWHCVRGGYSEEARPHLLRGAREAINAGAPHEAELALRSGMSLLSSGQREEGILLLAEALHELNRMADSLHLLQEHSGWISAEHESIAIVLKTEARFELGMLSPEHLEAEVDQLLDSTSNASPSVQASAMGLCARITDYVRSVGLARRLWTRCATQDLSLDRQLDRLRWTLARAMLAYQLRRREVSTSLVFEAQALVEKNGLRNTLAVRLFAGLGALAATAGNYAEARDHYMLAYRIAGNLDNDAQGASVAANAALCLGRLGEYNDQILWAERALAKGSYSDQPGLLQALTNSGFGHAMLGHRPQAQEYARQVLSHFIGYPTQWLEQRCYLACADIYQLLGSTKEAEECAMRATANGLGEPLALGLIGSHARWTAWLARHQCISMSLAQQVLGVAGEKRTITDALDRLEILCAMDKLTPLGLDQRTELEEALHRMPAAVRDQLVRLDAL